ncbi:DUF3102 domain-containing protein [Bosea sp. PAMC 26642]|uniref:DUF3102 domain-containing protein n=1 Tax=Bosea sp. (strain PAMC 26642) TaxID=1792307 RepID=UPI00143BC0A2|nr:DUF3102 domain-containing protein [Bosea sp. PAMC 26642]
MASPDEQLEAIARDVERTFAVSAWSIGERLAEARALYRYHREEGGFGGWAEKRLGMSDRRAREFINIFENIGIEKSAQLRRLSTRALIDLASPSTTEATRTEVEELLAKGDKVTAQTIKEIAERAKLDAALIEAAKHEKAALIESGQRERGALQETISKVEMERAQVPKRGGSVSPALPSTVSASVMPRMPVSPPRTGPLHL